MNTFEINAILERLTAQSDTFDPEDARRLIAAVPITTKIPLSMTYEYDSKGMDTRGNAAGHGEVNIPGESKRKSYSVNADPEHRIGGFVVTHRKGCLRISLMWASTRTDETGQHCLVNYNKVTGEPIDMEISVHRSFGLFGVPLFKILTFRPWKIPARVF